VQRHRGLAGARSALHHQRARQLGADDPVLFGLDGLDDVPHPAGPAGGEGGEQRRLAGHLLVRGGGRGGQVEHLIVEAGHLALPGPQVPSAADALRVGGGGEVEGACRRGPPVDQQRFVVAAGVEDADSADVVPAVVIGVQPAEAQAVLDGGELLHLLAVHLHRAVALGSGLECATRGAQLFGEPLGGLFPQRVQPAVEHRDVLLLLADLVVVHRRITGVP